MCFGPRSGRRNITIDGRLNPHGEVSKRTTFTFEKLAGKTFEFAPMDVANLLEIALEIIDEALIEKCAVRRDQTLALEHIRELDLFLRV